ncbi:hypothetical protein BC830DRAFT_1103652 [Chytriomyces sp. MP71]|nr:hypothetical protein BC830DRAFT_1103652 [Chytriomyces sp. MP71]
MNTTSLSASAAVLFSSAVAQLLLAGCVLFQIIIVETLRRSKPFSFNPFFKTLNALLLSVITSSIGFYTALGFFVMSSSTAFALQLASDLCLCTMTHSYISYAWLRSEPMIHFAAHEHAKTLRLMAKSIPFVVYLQLVPSVLLVIDPAYAADGVFPLARFLLLGVANLLIILFVTLLVYLLIKFLNSSQPVDQGNDRYTTIAKYSIAACAWNYITLIIYLIGAFCMTGDNAMLTLALGDASLTGTAATLTIMKSALNNEIKQQQKEIVGKVDPANEKLMPALRTQIATPVRSNLRKSESSSHSRRSSIQSVHFDECVLDMESKARRSISSRRESDVSHREAVARTRELGSRNIPAFPAHHVFHHTTS